MRYCGRRGWGERESKQLKVISPILSGCGTPIFEVSHDRMPQSLHGSGAQCFSLMYVSRIEYVLDRGRA